jgi:DNA-binding IclR family transcriptional regulator
MTGPGQGPSSLRGTGIDHAPTVNRSVVRALSILELLSRSDGPMALGEVATRLKLPKSSALSLLRALVAGEFCVTDDKGHYALGVHSFEVGAGYLRSMTPVRSVAPELEWLTEVLGVTSHFAVLERDEVIYLAKHDPPGLGLKLASSLGARLPAAVTAVGKAQLAHRRDLYTGGLPDGAPSGTAEAEEQEEIPPAGGDPRSPGEHRVGDEPQAGQARLDRELQTVRKLGYAVDDGQTAVGIRCVAAPLFNDGGCCGAIGVSYLLGGGPSAPTVAEAVVEAATRASARLGGRQHAGSAR